jgi:hypothetical protein
MATFQLLKFVALLLCSRFVRVGSFCIVDLWFELFIQYFNALYLLGTKSYGWEFGIIIAITVTWKVVRLWPFDVDEPKEYPIPKQKNFRKLYNAGSSAVRFVFRNRPLAQTVEKMVTLQFANVLAYFVLAIVSITDYFQDGGEDGWLFSQVKRAGDLHEIFILLAISISCDFLSTFAVYFGLHRLRAQVPGEMIAYVCSALEKFGDQWFFTFCASGFTIVICIENMVLPDGVLA